MPCCFVRTIALTQQTNSFWKPEGIFIFLSISSKKLSVKSFNVGYYWFLFFFVIRFSNYFMVSSGFLLFFFLVRTYLFLIKINIFAKIIFTNKKHIWSLFPPEAIAGGLVVASPQHIHWWKVSISGVILVRIFQHSYWIRTRITPNRTLFTQWLPEGF